MSKSENISKEELNLSSISVSCRGKEEEEMSGKGAKGLITGKTPAQSKDKDKKKPISRSSRAGLQVPF